MDKNIFSLIFGFTIILISCFPQDNQADLQYFNLGGYAQGTTYHISYGSIENRNYRDEIDSIFLKINGSLSTYDSTSLISRINRNDSTAFPDKYLTDVISKSGEISKMTNGAFDITVAPLVRAWGFGKNQPEKMDKQKIQQLKRFINYQFISLSEKRLIKKYPEVIIDLNAIAPGFTVDVIAEFFESQKINNYMIEIGGEIRTKGKNDKGEFWKIGIDKPIDRISDENRDIQTVFYSNQKSISTSGNYRKYYIKDGIKYSHTIDPASGYPVNHNLLSATIIAPDCAKADAYATAFMVMGLEKGKEFLKTHAELEAYLIYSDEKGEFKVFCTPGMAKLLL